MKVPPGRDHQRDDDLFARSAKKLGVRLDRVVTARQLGAHKPSERGFHEAFERIGLPRERILHVAQSLFHDHVTAKRLGLATVWTDRRHVTLAAARPGAARTGDASCLVAYGVAGQHADLERRNEAGPSQITWP